MRNLLKEISNKTRVKTKICRNEFNKLNAALKTLSPTK